MSFAFMKSLTMPIAIEPFDYTSQKGARIIFDDTHYVDIVQYSNYLKDKKDFIISLVLLKNSLVDCAEFKFENICLIFEIPKHRSKPERRRSHSVCRLFDLQSNIIRIEITNQDIENILHYFLTSYRDGIAGIDHIDVDFDHPEFCVTLTFMLVPCRS